MQIKKTNILTIIVTYNGSKWIKKCITSLKKNTILSDIFVVDNASTDDTITLLEAYGDVIIDKRSKNLGFGQANNIGMQYALENKYDYVFLLNQDTYIENNTIEVLVNISISNNEYGIISPLHYYSDEKSLEYFFSTRLSPNLCKNFISDCLVKGRENLNQIYPLNFVNAAAWFIPRRTLEVIGGFDPIFFHYGEDNNYCHRLIFHQIKIGITPKTKIYHDCKIDNTTDKIEFDQKIKIIKLELMVKYSNINLKASWLNIQCLSLKYFGLAFFKLFLFQFEAFKINFVLSYFILKNSFKITYSRNFNKVLDSNYLK